MQKILEASLLYRMLTALFGWFGRKWRSSRIVTWFVSPGLGEAVSESSVFSRLGRFIHGLLVRLFKFLRLNKLFEGSIFKASFFWCLLPAALAPLVPTMILLCLVIIGFFSFIIRLGCDSNEKLAFSPVNKYVVLFAVLYIAATFTSVTVSGSLYSGLLLAAFTLFAVVFLNSVKTMRQAVFAIKVFVLAGTVVSLYGVYQYFFYAPNAAGAWIDNDMFSEITKRVYSTLENPNVLAEYLLLIIPFAFAAVLNAKTWPKRLFFLCCAGLMVICMVMTISRGGWLGLLFAAAIFLVMLDSRLILLGIAGLVVLYFVLPDMIIDRFTSIGNLSDSSTSYRVSIWLGTIAMLKDYWLCGIGPGSDAFNLVYPAYSYNTVTAPHSHNLFLQIVCDTGISGIIIFVIILFSFYRTTFSAVFHEKAKETRTYLIACVSAISGFLVQSMTDYSFYNYRVVLFFWIVVILGAVLARSSKMEGNYLWSRS
jgi:putative inorganic carbon (HCO3(-)) transporter